jgi:DNA-binding response OmpR family regulator
MADRKKSILIVEDEAPLALALGNALEQEGYAVLTAKDGEDGMRVALEKHPDVILADLKLPKMTGIDMIKQIREDAWGKTANVIILTNISNPGTLEGAMSVGAFHYFVKSDSSMADIVRAIKTQVGDA